MRTDFGDTINVLWSQIWGSMEGDDRYLCEIYLRSASQKHLFAERRLRSLKKKMTEYKRKCTVEKHDEFRATVYPDSLPIEMDFDHCILSLRSSLEHLAQLINAVIPLDLPAKRIKKYDKFVSITNVISEIERNEPLGKDPCLSKLSSYLGNVIQASWYKELHDLRIESFHIKSGRLARTSLLTLDRQLLEMTFLLPSGTASSAKTEKERNIVNYCQRRVEDIERVLKVSFELLSKYLDSKLGDEWLQQP